MRTFSVKKQTLFKHLTEKIVQQQQNDDRNDNLAISIVFSWRRKVPLTGWGGGRTPAKSVWSHLAPRFLLAGTRRVSPRVGRVRADGTRQERAARAGVLRAPDHSGASLPQFHSQAGGPQRRCQRLGAGESVLLLLYAARCLRQEETKPVGTGVDGCVAGYHGIISVLRPLLIHRFVDLSKYHLAKMPSVTSVLHMKTAGCPRPDLWGFAAEATCFCFHSFLFCIHSHRWVQLHPLMHFFYHQRWRFFLPLLAGGDNSQQTKADDPVTADKLTNQSAVSFGHIAKTSHSTTYDKVARRKAFVKWSSAVLR